MGGKVISAIIAFWKAKGCTVSTARDTEPMWDTNVLTYTFLTCECIKGQQCHLHIFGYGFRKKKKKKKNVLNGLIKRITLYLVCDYFIFTFIFCFENTFLYN